MSTEQDNGSNVAEKKEQVAEVTEKLENLAVDTTNEADETRPAREARGPSAVRAPRRRGRGGRTTTGGNRFKPRLPYDEQVEQIAEQLKKKKVLETGVKGFVKWFSVRGRYGFVARDNAADEKEDFFVHQTAITKSSTLKYYLRTLDHEEPVVFDIVEGRKGPEAANVTGPDGENVRGSRYARQLLSQASRRGPTRGAGDRKPRETAADNEKNVEESGDGETRGKRRVRRARGKLQPQVTDENGEQKKTGGEEKGDGDAAVEKKPRRNRNRNKKEKSEAPAEEPKQEAAPAQA